MGNCEGKIEKKEKNNFTMIETELKLFTAVIINNNNNNNCTNSQDIYWNGNPSAHSRTDRKEMKEERRNKSPLKLANYPLIWFKHFEGNIFSF